MTMKTLLSTASLAILLAGAATTSQAQAQAQVALGHLTDYSGPTSDVGTPHRELHAAEGLGALANGCRHLLH